MRYAWALLAVVAGTLVNAWGRAYFDLADQAMVYLLAVLLVASRLSGGPSLVSAIASVAALDFFFVEPRYALGVHDLRHLVTFAVMLLVSLTVSALTLRIREQAEVAVERERHAAALFAMSRELAHTAGVEALAGVALAQVHATFGREAAVLLKRARLDVIAGRGDAPTFELAARAMQLEVTVGAASEWAPSPDLLVVPMLGSQGAFGALALRLGRTMPSPAQVNALEALVALIAPAIERGLMADEASRARVAAETEGMRNTLLAGVSHDLRTPLASIAGSASVLLDPTAVLDADGRRELVEAIRDEAGRLSRLVQGLLDLARLESGALTVKKQWCPVEEVLSSAVGRVDLSDRPVRTSLGEGELLLAPVDPVLFEQVFINLLENAAKYSPPGSPIEVRAWVEDDRLFVEVADQGTGVAPGDELRIFEKFYRASDGQRAPGAGLGLAVCEAIVKAHGGRIEAKPAERGAVFSIGLPLEGAAP